MKFKLILSVFFFCPADKRSVCIYRYVRNKPNLQQSARNDGLFTFFDHMMQFFPRIFLFVQLDKGTLHLKGDEILR